MSLQHVELAVPLVHADDLDRESSLGGVGLGAVAAVVCVMVTIRFSVCRPARAGARCQRE